MIRLWFLLTLLSTSCLVFSQNEVQLLGGFILPHRPEMSRLITGHATGITVSHWREAHGEWASNYGRWGIRQGVMVQVLDAGSESLGHQVAALWTTRLPIRERSHLELGLGPGWTSRSYRTDGANSFALAGPWNLGLHVGLSRRIRLKAPVHFSVGAAVTHLSNGGLFLPNLGTNALTLRLAIHHGSTPTRYPETHIPPSKFTRRGFVSTGMRFGARDAGLPGGPLHPVSTLRVLWEAKTHFITPGASPKRCSWSPLLAGQITLNQSRRAEEEGLPASRWQPAVLIGTRWWAGNVALQFAHGRILTNASPDFGAGHLDAALIWQLQPSWALELGLRAFSMRAEHPCIGLTWCPTPDNRSQKTRGKPTNQK